MPSNPPPPRPSAFSTLPICLGNLRNRPKPKPPGAVKLPISTVRLESEKWRPPHHAPLRAQQVSSSVRAPGSAGRRSPLAPGVLAFLRCPVCLGPCIFTPVQWRVALYHAEASPYPHPPAFSASQAGCPGPGGWHRSGWTGVWDMDKQCRGLTSSLNLSSDLESRS